MKQVFFIIGIIALLSSCAQESNLPSTELISKKVEKRSTPLSVTITYLNGTSQSFTTSSFIVEDELEGIRAVLDPTELNAQVVTLIDKITINGSNEFSLTNNPNGLSTVYTEKTEINCRKTSSGISVMLNPGNISFNTTNFIVVDEADGI